MSSEAKKIKKPSRFAVMARRPGGLSREKAIAKADGTIEKLKARYLDWVVNDLTLLEQQIDTIHRQKGQNPGQMDVAYKKVAQIRDLGATFDYPLTTEVADRFCELLYRLKHAGKYNYDAIQTLLGALQLVCTEAFQGKRAADEKPLLDGLTRVIGKYPAVVADRQEGPAA